MLRALFISLSKARWAQRLITQWRFAWKMASRFIAGETVEDALRAVKQLNAAGILATLDHLGENTDSQTAAEQSTTDILKILDAIHTAGLRSNVSIKLSQLGLVLDAELAYANLVTILERARQVGNFVRVDMEDSSLVALPLGEIRRVIVASPAFLREHGRPQHPNDLLKANCVRLVGYAPHWGRFQEGSKTFKLTVGGNLEFNHIAPAVQACADGAGFGQFLSYQVAPLLQSGALETVLDDFADAPRPIHVVYPHARLLPTRTRAFIDFIRQELKGFEPGHPPP